jgi:adenylate cyclase class 2
VSLVVDNFERALTLLEVIGLQKKAVQETKRERWQFGECEVTIDTWPWIPPFVEFEGLSEQVVRQAAATLGFDLARALHGSVEIAYQQYYDVTEAEIYNCPAIVFGPVPAWLEAKCRTV